MAENPMSQEEFIKMRKFIKPFSRLNVWVYKLTRGLLMGKFQGRPVMLVTMTGAKTGKSRTIPLMHVPYKEGVVVVGSQGGAPKSPVWVKSIQQNPEVVVQYKTKKMNLRARQADDAEKAEVWPTCVEHYPPYDDYQNRTERNIPMFICEPL
jgi:deazaflavin-dependent oxidoreductase (nitroreductase family)